MRLPRLSPRLLSPRLLFLGIVALGLPFAVAVGWSLGVPAAPAAPPPAAAPAGAGGLGAAPARTSSAPVKVVDYSSRLSRVPAGRSPAAGRAVTRPRMSSPAGSPRPAPALTDPPVPTPTAVVPSAPESPSAAPPDSPAPQPTGVGLIRR